MGHVLMGTATGLVVNVCLTEANGNLITPTSPPKWRKPLPYLKKSHGRGEGDGP